MTHWGPWGSRMSHSRHHGERAGGPPQAGRQAGRQAVKLSLVKSPDAEDSGMKLYLCASVKRALLTQTIVGDGEAC